MLLKQIEHPVISIFYAIAMTVFTLILTGPDIYTHDEWV
jgi:hypothetical protein